MALVLVKKLWVSDLIKKISYELPNIYEESYKVMAEINSYVVIHLDGKTIKKTFILTHLVSLFQREKL